MGWIEALYKARKILMIILKHFQILDILVIAWRIIGSNFSEAKKSQIHLQEFEVYLLYFFFRRWIILVGAESEMYKVRWINESFCLIAKQIRILLPWKKIIKRFIIKIRKSDAFYAETKVYMIVENLSIDGKKRKKFSFERKSIDQSFFFFFFKQLDDS